MRLFANLPLATPVPVGALNVTLTDGTRLPNESLRGLQQFGKGRIDRSALIGPSTTASVAGAPGVLVRLSSCKCRVGSYRGGHIVWSAGIAVRSNSRRRWRYHWVGGGCVHAAGKRATGPGLGGRGEGHRNVVNRVPAGIFHDALSAAIRKPCRPAWSAEIRC